MTAIEPRPDLDGDEDLAIELEDELAEAPDEFARFRRFTDDRRGRARQWLAGSDLRANAPVAPASPGLVDHQRLP